MLVGVPWSWIDSAPVGDVIIDPTTSVATSEDVWLESTSNKDANSAGLLIGKAGCCPKKRTIIKFNIAGSGIPSTATVLNAQMKLYYYSASNGGSGAWVDRWVQAHQILVNWNETQATRDNRLTGTPWNAQYVGLNDIDAKSTFESTVLFQSGQTGTWKIWNLAALTQKWVNGTATNYGVVLWATNEATNGYDLRFRSSENTPTTERPYLEVTYSTEAKTVYFLKDHLGSVRATVLDTATAPVRGYDDYDPWGYILAGRSMLTSGWSSNAGIVKNKFTGKEWDDEFGVNWNYFGARYYDSQTGRWLVVDPLAEKYLGWSPYNYVLNNPLKFFDPAGKDVAFHESARSNKNFNQALNLYNQTKLGSQQMERFKNDHKILVIYQVGDISKSAGGTIAGFTDWKIGSQAASHIIIGSEDMGIKDQIFNNEGKVVITITLDAEILGTKSTEKSAENVYHEGKAHIEYDRDKKDLTGFAVDAKTEHKLYGTDGVSPIIKGSPADQFRREAEQAKKKQQEERKK